MRQKKRAAIVGLVISAVAALAKRRRKSAHRNPGTATSAIAAAVIAVLQILQPNRISGVRDGAALIGPDQEIAVSLETISNVPAEPEPRTHIGRHCRQPTPEERRLVEAVDHGFREMYLTLTSIIQGVAFGFLAERTFNGQNPTVEQRIAFTICFMMIVTVWQEYMVGSTVFVWTPTLLDSVIPFAIGMTEFQLIAAARMGVYSFLVRLAIFLTVGTAAYLNWLVHARHGRANKAMYATLKSYIRFGASYCAAITAATLCLAQGLAAELGFSDAPLLAITLVGVAPLFLHSVFNWNLKLHQIRARIRDTETDHAGTAVTLPE